MKWVRRPEKNDLWRGCCRRQMHRSGIYRHEQPRLTDQGRECQQICFPGKVDNLFVSVSLDRRDVRLLLRRRSARQGDFGTVVLAEVVNYLRPSGGFP